MIVEVERILHLVLCGREQAAAHLTDKIDRPLMRRRRIVMLRAQLEPAHSERGELVEIAALKEPMGEVVEVDTLACSWSWTPLLEEILLH